MSTTAQDIIDGALKSLAVLPGSQTATGAQLQDALTALNLLCRSWEGHGLQGWIRKTGTVTLVSGTASYTCGTGGSGLTERPTKILRAWLKDSDGNETLVSPVSRQEYLDLPLKTSAGLPYQFYYDPQIASGVIYIYPVINDTGYTMPLDYQKPLTEVNSSTDTIDAPPEMLRALKWNLAMEVAPEYQMQVPEVIMRNAAESLGLAMGTTRILPTTPLFGWVDEDA